LGEDSSLAVRGGVEDIQRASLHRRKMQDGELRRSGNDEKLAKEQRKSKKEKEGAAHFFKRRYLDG